MPEQESKNPFSIVSTRAQTPNPGGNANEKNERLKSSPLLGLLPGLLLIMLGGLFWLAQHDYLEGDWWQYFLVGLGAMILVESYLQYRSNSSRLDRLSRWVLGLLIILSGFLYLFDPNNWWPLGLIAAGLVLCLLSVWRRRRKTASEINQAP